MPAEAWAAVQAAADRYDELAEQGVELRFSVAPGGLEIAVFDAAGERLRSVAAAEALDIAGGAPVE